MIIRKADSRIIVAMKNFKKYKKKVHTIICILIYTYTLQNVKRNRYVCAYTNSFINWNIKYDFKYNQK